MKLRKFFSKRRAVSPIIATILLISVSLAAGVAVSVILSNVDESSPTVETESALGISGSSSLNTVNIVTDVTELSGDILLMQQNVFDYVSLTIELTYTGSEAFIYVIDFDVLVYGNKLDDISQWTIDSADGAVLTSVNGAYGGWKHAQGDTINYVLVVEDPNNPQARVPDKTTFSYEVKYGHEAGIISNKVLKERESKIIFEYVAYNISLFHWGSSFIATSAASQLEQTLSFINGTNNMFFLYTRSADAYDISNQAVVDLLNITAINEQYEMVLVDKWVVPNAFQGGSPTNIITQLHEMGTSLVFYGTLLEFTSLNNPNYNEVMNSIDLTATKNITGLVPNPYDQAGNARGSQNSYRFFASLDGSLTGLATQTFTEVPSQLNQLLGRSIGDIIGFDAAELTDTPEGFDVLGNATYNIYSERRESQQGPANELFTNNGPLYIRKNKVINVTGEVYAFTWKTTDNFRDTGAIKIDEYHLTNARENMILSLVSELERQSFEYAELVIDDMTLNVNQNTRFQIEVTATVTNADVNGGTLELTVDMPDQLQINNFPLWAPRYDMFVNGSQVVSNGYFGLTLDYVTNTYFVDVEQDYTGNIPENSVILIRIEALFTWIRLDVADTNYYDWFITMDFESGVFALPGSDFYTINTAIDRTIW
ncbi:MAG: archaellin/type IV pilin N-terminal domain-containing protein [Candidatus Kariarchaeaceae archaeon]|jgi:FlaG/FlaF family flagellin (archaellin)